MPRSRQSSLWTTTIRLNTDGDRSVAHGGAVQSEDFERSEFCVGCHQFPANAAINGKPLENTYGEWRASRFSAEGLTCQRCHMPGQRHLFRGIHDPATVAAGLTAQVSTSHDDARFLLTSSSIGHAFPTYTTPRVVMRGIALDQNGRELPNTAMSESLGARLIGRSVVGRVQVTPGFCQDKRRH